MVNMSNEWRNVVQAWESVTNPPILFEPRIVTNLRYVNIILFSIILIFRPDSFWFVAPCIYLVLPRYNWVLRRCEDQFVLEYSAYEGVLCPPPLRTEPTGLWYRLRSCYLFPGGFTVAVSRAYNWSTHSWKFAVVMTFSLVYFITLGGIFVPVISGIAMICFSAWDMGISLAKAYARGKLASMFVPQPGDKDFPPAWGYIALLATKSVMLYHLRHSKVGIAAFCADLVREFGIAPSLKAPIIAAVNEIKRLLGTIPSKLTKSPPKSTDTLMKEFKDGVFPTEPMGFTASHGMILSGIAFALASVMKITGGEMLNYTPPTTLKMMASQIRDFNTLKEHAWPVVIELVNSMYKHISGSPDPFVPSLHGQFEDRWNALWPQVQSYLLPRKGVFTEAEQVHATSLYMQMNQLYLDANTASAPAAQTRCYHEASLQMLHVIHNFNKSLWQTNRPVPVAVWAIGPAGTGKSRIFELIASSLAKHCKIPDTTVTIDPASKYQDNYNGQSCINLNDVCSQVLPEGISKEANFIKLLIDGEYFAVEKSSVEGKNTSAYTPNLVFISSNAPTPYHLFDYMRRGGVAESAAERRMHFVIELTEPKAGRELKDHENASVDDFYKDLRLLRWNDKGVPYRQVITVSQLIANIVTLHGIHVNNFTARSAFPLELKSLRQFSCTLTGGSYDPYPNRTEPTGKKAQSVGSWLSTLGWDHPALKAVIDFNRPMLESEWDDYRKALSKDATLVVDHILTEEDWKCVVSFSVSKYFKKMFGVIDPHLFMLCARSAFPFPIPERAQHLWKEMPLTLDLYTLEGVCGYVARGGPRSEAPTFTTVIKEKAASSIEEARSLFDLKKVRDSKRTAYLVSKYSLLAGLVGVTGALAVGGLLWHLFRDNLERTEPTSGKDEPKPSHAEKRRKHKRKPIVPVIVSQPSLSVGVAETLIKQDPGSIQLLQSVMAHNSCHMVITRGDVSYSQYVLMTGNHHGVCTDHFFHKVDWSKPFEYDCVLTHVHQRQTFGRFKLSDCTVRLVQEKIDDYNGEPVYLDAAAIDFPANIPRFKCIAQHFLSPDRSELAHLGAINVALWSRDTQKSLVISRVLSSADAGVMISGANNRYIGSYVRVAHDVEPGDCGLPAVVSNPHVQSKIIGILIARARTSTGNYAYYSMIPPALLEGSETTALPVLAESVGRTFDTPHGPVPAISGVTIYGKVPPAFTARVNLDLSMHQSPFCSWSCPQHDCEAKCNLFKCSNSTGKWCPPLGKMHKKDGKWIHPLYESINKANYCPLSLHYVGQENWFEHIRPQIRRLFSYFIPPPLSHLPARLSVKEAINGVLRADGAILLPRIPWQTAVGVPFCNLKGVPDPPGPHVTHRGKARFLKCPEHGNLGVCNFEGCDSRERYITDEVKAALKARLQPGTPGLDHYQVFLKVECREPGKLPRKVGVSPFDATIYARQLLLPLLSGMLVHCDDPNCFSAIGTNVHSMAYHECSLRRRKFKYGLHGDRGSGDVNFHSITHQMAEDIIIAAIDAYFMFDSALEEQEFKLEVRRLLGSYENAVHVVNDVAISWFSSLPSGLAITAVLNTLGYGASNYGVWAYYRCLHHRPYTVEDYAKEILTKTYGDDFWMAHDDPEFTMDVFCPLAKSLYGQNVTNPTNVGKTASIVPTIPPSEIEMLKRTDKLHEDGYFHGALDRDSIFKPLRYNSDNTPQGTAQIVNSVLLELYEFGDRSLFKEWYQKFLQYLVDCGLPNTLPSWEDCHRQWMSATSSSTRVMVFANDVLVTQPMSATAGINAAAEGANSAVPQEVAPFNEEARSTEVARIQAGGNVRSVLDRTVPYSIRVSPDITDRLVRLGQFVFSTASSFGVSLFNIRLPSDIISLSPFLIAHLNGHRFMRCDARILFRINAPPFSTGAFMITRSPGTDIEGVHSTTLYTKSHLHPIVASIDQPSDVDIALPYASPFAWIEASQMASVDYRSACAHIAVDAIVPMASSGASAPTSTVVEVYGKLENVILTGPDPAITWPMQAEAWRESKELLLHSKLAPTVTEPMMAEKKADPPAPSKEAQDKARTLVARPTPIPTDLGGQITYGITHFFDSLFGAVGKVAPFVGSVLKFLLDKPQDERPPEKTYVQVFPSMYTKGIDQSLTLGTFHGERVAAEFVTQPNILEMCRQPVLWFTTLYTSASPVAGQVIANFDLEPTRMCSFLRTGAGPFTYTFRDSALSFYSRRYAAWSGSFKLMIMVHCPPSVSGRLAILVIPPGSTLPVDCRSSFGNYLSTLHEYRGPTIIKLTVPTLSRFGIVPTNKMTGSVVASDFLGGRLGIFSHQPPISYDTSATVSATISVWVAAAEDFKLYRYRGWQNINLTDNDIQLKDIPKEQLQAALAAAHKVELAPIKTEPTCDVFREFSQVFPPMHPKQEGGFTTNIFAPEEEINVVGLMKRPSHIGYINAPTTYVAEPTSGTSLYEMCVPFKFWKGGIIFRTIIGSTANQRVFITPSYGWTTGTGAADYDAGLVTSHAALAPELSVTLPWLSSFNYLESVDSVLTAYHDYGVTISADTYTNNIGVAYSASDNFGVAHWMGPPEFVIVNAAVNGKEIPIYARSGDSVFLDRRPEIARILALQPGHLDLAAARDLKAAPSPSI